MKFLFTTIILTYLKFLTKLQLMKVHPLVIGVTGSAGKSSTVKALAVALKNDQRIKIGHKGNSQTGIPFEILEIPVKDYQGTEWFGVCGKALRQVLTNWTSYDVLILEMGIDSDRYPNNMEYLLSIVEPDIGVLLNVGAVHSANYIDQTDPVQSVANEKGKLLTQLPAQGLAVFSDDQPQIQVLVPQIKSQMQTFSVNPKSSADVVLKNYQVSTNGTTFTFVYKTKDYVLHFQNKLFLKESFGGFATAVCIADFLGISIGTTLQNLERNLVLPPGRMSIIEGVENTTIIDSSYNSSPGSTFPALEMFGKLKGRKGVVLGDMRELGNATESAHKELATYASKVADWIVLVGPLTREFSLSEFKKIKYPEKNIISVLNARQAIKPVQKFMHKNDLILVKGSQNTILLEIVVEALMARPDKADELLCRQTPYWEQKRAEIQL